MKACAIQTHLFINTMQFKNTNPVWTIRCGVRVNMKFLLCNCVLCVWVYFNYHIHLRCVKSNVSHPEGKAHHLKHLLGTLYISTHKTTSTSDTVMSPWSVSYEVFNRLQWHLYRHVHHRLHSVYHSCLGWHRHHALLFIWYAKECCGAAPRSLLKYFTPHVTQSGSSSIRMSSKSEVAPSQ